MSGIKKRLEEIKSEGIVYRALALDLDGTLMDSEKKLSEENKHAVWQAIEAGTAVVLASGRPMFGVMPVAKQLELDKRGGYVLAYNGGNIWDCKASEMVYERHIPSECIAAICDAARKNQAAPLTYFEDRVISEKADDEYVLREAFCNSAEVMQVDNIPEFVDYPVAKLLVVGEHSRLLPVKEELEKQYGDVLELFFSEDYFLEIVPKNVGKDVSLAALLDNLGIEQKELIACGDGLNDLSMISYAGLGIAMENAYPEVKERADYVTVSNDENGVARIIKEFILK